MASGVLLMRKTTGMTKDVQECLAEMGVTDVVFEKMRSATNAVDGAKILEDAKAACRKGFRAVAAGYHPDHNQHLSPEEIKTKEDRFKRLRSVHDSFLESKYRAPHRDYFASAAADYWTGRNSWQHGNHDDPIIKAFIKQRQAQEAAETQRIQEVLDILRRKSKPRSDINNGHQYRPEDMKVTVAMELPGKNGIWKRDISSDEPAKRKPRIKKSQTG